ncbi:serine hydrolase [Streptomyces sp. NPDC093065]|uniref:serine hydrolase n=1 Tax=Streptomyces sp. NPDC093065 TaxID=3366021 RepID=UPI00380D8783
MTRPIGIDDLHSIALPEQPSLSPNGTRVVYVLRTADREHDRDERALWTVPTGTGAARRLTHGLADTAPAWSPDGDRIAFLRGGDHPAQVWLLPTDGGESEPVTELPLGAGTPVWSPDGTSIAFTAPVDRQPSLQGEAKTPLLAVGNRLDHRADDGGVPGTVHSHLHVLDLADHRVRQVTDGDWHAGIPAWSPDGRSLAFCSDRGPAAGLTPGSGTYVVDVSPHGGGTQPRPVGGATGVAQAVTWTAEGDALLVVGRTDTEPGHAGLLRMPLDGGPTVDLTRGLNRDVLPPGGPVGPGASPQVTDGARTVLFCVRDRGCVHLYAIDTVGGTPRPLVGGPDRVVSGLSAAKDTAVVVLATPGSDGEIVAVEQATGRERVLTRHGTVLDDASLSRAQERECGISDGGTAHGWLRSDSERACPAPLPLNTPTKPATRSVGVSYWRRRLTELAERHQVPGAVLGIARGAHTDVAAHGVLNKATGVTTTRDSLFQIGSITKVWTATLAMQLVDEGALDLDAPVADVLPELRLADQRVARQVTMRHLLAHTSGIDGDVFTDTGRGDDCLERFVGQLDEAAQNHPLGATFSYCNSGFVLAGRVIEKLTGMTWDRALGERLCTPLGLKHTVTLPEEALRFRTAMGHDSEGDEPARPVPVWSLPRSAGPAGLITATAEDVLAFARLHLAGGTASDGTRLLSERAARAMTEQQVELPDTLTLGDSWGLGWIRFGWDGRRLIGHDGSTLGQAAFLRVLPEQDLAVTLLTNGGAAKDLYRELFGEIFAELAGVALPEPPRPPSEPVSVDVRRYLGRYERAGTRIDILEGTEGLRLRYTTTGPLAHLVPEPVQETTLMPVSDSQFVVRYAGSPSWVPVTFYSLSSGERYVHHGMRATPMVP